MRARQYGLARAELDVCMVVLHVDEATSIQRQQARQLQAESHNAAVRSSGEGSLMCASTALFLCLRKRLASVTRLYQKQVQVLLQHTAPRFLLTALLPIVCYIRNLLFMHRFEFSAVARVLISFTRSGQNLN